MFLHVWHPTALLFTVGHLQIHWYGLFLAIGAIVGILVAAWFGRHYTFDPNKFFDLGLITLVVGFVGARLYHVSNEWSYYAGHPADIFRVWNGGLALHGGILLGSLAAIVVARRWRWNPWLVADSIVPALALAQAIGRWGNYFNQELFGRPTSLPWGIPIDAALRPAADVGFPYFHPTFLYESLGLLVIAGALWWLHTRVWTGKKYLTQPGTIALFYVILYSALRLATETLRIDRTPIIGGVRLPILVSSALILFALVVWFIRHRQSHAQPSRS